jgi:hypothetical protein
MVVQENKDATSSEHEYLHRAMLQSWRLLLLRALQVLTRNMFYDTVEGGLSQAVAVIIAVQRCGCIVVGCRRPSAFVNLNSVTNRAVRGPEYKLSYDAITIEE